MRCSLCDANNTADARFCGYCGASLHGAATESLGELKQVTVLFCDIVDSTGMAERLGPEAMHDVVLSFIDPALAEVHRYGGTAPQFLGDGFMALFGAPATQEDHVRRGLLAALAILGSAGRKGENTLNGRRQPVSVRIGLHTGVVVFGPVATRLHMDPTAIGDTANVAARIQQAADPGTILISEATYRLANGYAHVEPVAPLTLKGKVEPAPAYRLLGYSDRRSALDAPASSRVRDFVGRGGEFASLSNIARQVETGRGWVVGLVGEPGIGKSRLLAEFRRRPADVDWVEARCLSYNTATPYMLVLDLLRSDWGIGEADLPNAAIEKVRYGLEQAGIDAGENAPFLLHLLGLHDVGDTSGDRNTEAHKERTFAILRRLQVNRSRRRPRVLVLEDVHWIDKLSEEFLVSLVEVLPGTGILTIATYRPEYRPPWASKPWVDEISLAPLSREDSLQVVRSVLRENPHAEPLIPAIVEKGDGNPFFLEQLALHAGEGGNATGTVPNTIHDVVMARIDRLPEAPKRLLQIAAVIGREFSYRLLAAVWPGPGVVEPYLHELIQLAFIDERFGGERTGYFFHHALTQETVYASLLERNRRFWHGKIGHAIETFYEGHAEEVAERLALHFGHSDEPEKAVDYAILAAEKSQRRWANSEALAYFEGALSRLDAMPDTEANRLRRIDAALKQADVRYDLAQYTEYLQILEGIRDLVEQTGEPRHRAVWHYWTGLLHSVTGSRLDIAIEHCHQAVKIASAHRLEDVDAFATSCLAQVYIVAGRLRHAIESGERALTHFEARGNHWWAVRTLWFLNIAASYLGDWCASIEYCRRGLDHSTALGNPLSKSVQPVCWARMGWAYIHQGDIERGLRCCEEALAFSPILPRYAALAKAARGHGQIKAGRFEAGFAELREALAWLHRSGFRFTYLTSALPLAEGYLRRGDTESARPLIQDILETSGIRGYSHIEGRACWLMGECLASEGSAAAEGYVESAMQILEPVGARNDFAKAMLTRAALRQRLGDLGAAHRLLERAATLFRELGTLDEPARVEAALAALDRGSPIPLLNGAA